MTSILKSIDTTLIACEYTTGDFRSNFAAWFPAFVGNCTNKAFPPFGDLASLNMTADQLTLSGQKIRYKFNLDTAASQGNLAWMEEFTPADDPTTPENEANNPVEYYANSWTQGGNETGIFTLDPPATNRFGTYSLIVLKVDLDVDSNNNGTITDADDPIEENSPGKLISVNDDDDDEDGNSDNADAVISGTAAQKAADKLEMAEVRLSLAPTLTITDGHAFLRVSQAGRIRVFDQNDAEFLSATDTEKEVPWADINGSTLSFRAEGVIDGAVNLELVFKKGTTEICSDKVVIKSVEADISAYSTSEGCFAGYAQQCTPGRTFGFDTGRDFIDGLINKTTTYGMLGDINVFSHAWVYQSTFGVTHNGGFWGGGPNASGFYGTTVTGDHADARTLADLQTALNNGTIKLFPGRRIFLEGCHIGEIGTFVSALSTMTSRQVISACGSSSEKTDGGGHIYFSSGPEDQAELTDPDYDGWLKGATQVGGSLYAW